MPAVIAAPLTPDANVFLPLQRAAGTLQNGGLLWNFDGKQPVNFGVGSGQAVAALLALLACRADFRLRQASRKGR